MKAKLACVALAVVACEGVVMAKEASVIMSDAYRNEASGGQVMFVATHGLDALTLKARTHEARFVTRRADGLTIERPPDCLAVGSARVSYDVTDFPMGASEVAFVVRDEKTKAERSRCAMTFARLAPMAGRRVSLDVFGRLSVKGRRVFPIVRCGEKGLTEGANCIRVSAEKTTRKLLDDCELKNLLVIVTVENGRGIDCETVAVCRNHPAFLGWMACVGKSGAAQYEFLRDTDADHPVFDARMTTFGLCDLWQAPQGRICREGEKWPAKTLQGTPDPRAAAWQQVANGANAVLFADSNDATDKAAVELGRVKDILLREPGPELKPVGDAKPLVRTWKGDAEDEFFALVVNPRAERLRSDVVLPYGKWIVGKSPLPSAGVRSAGGRLTLDLSPREVALFKLKNTIRVPKIVRLGTIDTDIVEANTILFKGRLLHCEFFRRHGAGRFFDLADMKTFTPEFGKGCSMHCAFVAGDKVVVTANAKKGKAFVAMESSDLVHWTEPVVIQERPDWGTFFNTSVCKAGDRYVMVGEIYHEGPKYVMNFYETKDFKTWRWIDDAGWGVRMKEYAGSPCLRYHDGWFYFFTLVCDDRNAEERPLWRMRVVRSRDLKTWAKGNRVVLGFDQVVDRRPHPDAVLTDEQRVKMAQAEDRNASDIDFCEYKGDLYVAYSWGNQLGKEFLALAKIPGWTERAFLESFFDGYSEK